jgi:hypothetical protein
MSSKRVSIVVKAYPKKLLRSLKSLSKASAVVSVSLAAGSIVS